MLLSLGKHLFAISFQNNTVNFSDWRFHPIYHWQPEIFFQLWIMLIVEANRKECEVNGLNTFSICDDFHRLAILYLL